MLDDLPLTRDLVLVGGGHCHALVMLKWAMRPLPGARLTIIDPQTATPYTGMLPGHVAGHYSRNKLDIDLVKLSRHCDARLIQGSVTGIDLQNKQIMVPGRPEIPYDLISLDIGVTSDLKDVPGFSTYAHAAKPLANFANSWRVFLDDLVSNRKRPKVVVIGGGVAGAELSLAIAYRLRKALITNYEVTIIETAEQVLSEIGNSPRERILSRLKDFNVSVRTGSKVRKINPHSISLEDGTDIDADFVLGAAGARPHLWLSKTGLDLSNGFVAVGPDLSSTSDDSVFAVGDCAHMVASPRPKAGVFAVRQAPVLYHNLFATLSGGTRRRFYPQRDFLKLVSLGGKEAVAEKFGFAFQGRWLWSLKDRIDQKFMDQFNSLPEMLLPVTPKITASGVREAIADRKPLCGGCGAKVGFGPLIGALEQLPHPTRNDVELGRGDDAAVLKSEDTRQVFTTDHLRAFTNDPWLFSRIAALHALSDIWAMGAKPQAGLISVTLPMMTEKIQVATLREITNAAVKEFKSAGADIVGGHTSLGRELTIGFSATGLIESDGITHSGAKPGDSLILTKPIGTGILLAAEMQKRAKGEWIENTFATMLQSQGQASLILSKSANAMTDVTGFGLAGHLLNILDASAVAARISYENIPILEGAEYLAKRGIRSTLWKSNAMNADRIRSSMSCPIDLLFDPQTSGGLLAAVPSNEAIETIGKLREIGANAANIGNIVAGKPIIHLDKAC